MGSIYPSIHPSAAHQAGAGQLPSSGTEHPQSRPEMGCGERSPSRAEISGATCITHRAALRSWGSRPSTGEENRPGHIYRFTDHRGEGGSFSAAHGLEERMLGSRLPWGQGPGAPSTCGDSVPSENRYNHCGSWQSNLQHIHGPRRSSCTGTANHQLLTHTWEAIFASTKKKHAQRWKRGNFQNLKGIISKN